MIEPETFIGPLLLPALGRKYPMGLYKVQDTWVYTNRGLGVNCPPVRLNCQPEITLFTLRSTSETPPPAADLRTEMIALGTASPSDSKDAR